ncbi:hypothetical protein M5K25_021879 [Dendrobium thyrsiflorum]|uniref:Protein EARLY HEADING DATE 2 n=1 Tax=Dendrobium thyrsiflorum TaxID=117978 RepID=A0ABD0UAP7_DENTH
MAAASSSSPFFGIRDEESLNHLKQQQMLPILPPTSSIPSSSSNLQVPAPVKKKRNLPGNPNPDAEVIALSPKTLMATNRFICEVCNKGFQREQNLQLHRRGHNLPWKLKQKSNKEVRRRVYLCPEPTCVHHDPSRALGDLTGIKKHFCRKHGEKKWKCDKCSKRYAVQSDWKAHSKTCGTREYRCDCGTLFSRRDSFITHRAFCDALAQESARIPTGIANISSHLYSGAAINLGLSQVNPHLSALHNQTHPPTSATAAADLLRLGDHLISPSQPSSFRSTHPPPSPSFFLSTENFQNKPPFHTLMQLPDLQPNSTSSSTPNLFNQTPHHLLMMQDQFPSNNPEPSHLYDQMGGGMQALFNTSLQNDSVVNLPQMSATALLQKAAQMGATSSNNTIKGFGSSSSTRSHVENENHLQDIMNSFANGNSGIFSRRGDQEAKFGDYNAGFCHIDEGSYHNNGLTRDFLGVGNLLRSMGGGISSQREQQQQHHHGAIDISGSLDSEMKPASSTRSFASGTLR